MKKQLNEIQRLQKIAGILKESINEAPLTINQVIKQLNKIANSKGFYAVDKSPDEKLDSVYGMYNLVKWEDDSENTIELFSLVKGKNATSDDLVVNYSTKSHDGRGPYEPWLKPNTWDSYFNDDEDSGDNEDPLYIELANEIGEKKLQKLLMKGWELDDIAADPQGAAASIK